MNVDQLVLSQDDAVKLLHRYETHRNYQKPDPIDMEVERIAKLIAKGKVVIRGLGSVIAAGLNEETKLPKLAIARADSPWCRLNAGHNGSAVMLSGVEWANGNTAHSRLFEFAVGSFPGIASKSNQKAIMPHIPPDIRPRRGIENYTVVWEALWEKVPPVDPILCRRIGKSDFFLVLAQWDLTEVERAVMQSRIGRH